jgi:hypothetical protein
MHRVPRAPNLLQSADAVVLKLPEQFIAARSLAELSCARLVVSRRCLATPGHRRLVEDRTAPATGPCCSSPTGRLRLQLRDRLRDLLPLVSPASSSMYASSTKFSVPDHLSVLSLNAYK